MGRQSRGRTADREPSPVMEVRRMDYRITVVDDDALSLKYVSNILNDKGMEVVCLESGPELLRYMEDNDTDLILLDIQMPEMNGFETFHALRRQEEHNGKKRTPIIFLTGEDGGEAERRSLNAGASDLIRKPFDPEILISRVTNTVANNRMVESLTEDATIDKLTGFLNKSSGTGRIAAMCSEMTGALIVFDLDNFKLVNDLFGHDMGDNVLEALSEVFRFNTRANDVISRIGGDEFMGFFSDLLVKDSIMSLIERLNDNLTARCTELMGEEFDIPIGISAGVVFVPEHGTDYETLFRLADGALYKAKQNGKHECRIYDISAADEDEKNDPKEEMLRITQLMEERGAGKGALLLGQDAFGANYRLIVRFLKLFGGRADKVLFTLNPLHEREEDITEAARQFGELLKGSLRECDIVFQSRDDQFFALIPEMPGEPVRDIKGMISAALTDSGLAELITVTYTTETVYSA